MVVGLLLAAIAACGTIYGGFLAKSGYDRYVASSAIPSISYQKIALFWVRIDEGMYQLGAVTKLYNGDSKSYSIKGVTFEGRNWTLFPRGSYLIRRLAENVDHAELLEDNYLKPDAEKYLKKLLPIKFDMTINGGQTPEFVIRGDWNLLFEGRQVCKTPQLYAVDPDPISQSEWDNLLKPQSKIDVESFYYRPIPERPPEGGFEINYLVYNLDRSARISNPYFAETNSAKGKNGIMVFIRGKGEPPLMDGWQVLGQTYYEVWSDPEKLALYNSLFPPDADGKPRPLGFFAGLEQEMAGPINRSISAPTTRASDIIEFTWPNAKN